MFQNRTHQDRTGYTGFKTLENGYRTSLSRLVRPIGQVFFYFQAIFEPEPAALVRINGPFEQICLYIDLVHLVLYGVG